MFCGARNKNSFLDICNGEISTLEADQRDVYEAQGI